MVSIREMMDISGAKVVVSGTFGTVSEEEARQSLSLRGAVVTNDVSSARCLFFGTDHDVDLRQKATASTAMPEPSGDGVLEFFDTVECDFIDTNVESYLSPLGGYVDRWKASLDRLEEGENSTFWDACIVYKHFAPPASEEAIQAAEEKLGFPLDDALKNLYRQANGMTLGIRGGMAPAGHTPQEGPFSSEFFMTPNPKPELWKVESWDETESLIGVINIAPIEQLFGPSQANDVYRLKTFDPEDTVYVKGMVFNSQDFYQHLYLFDGHHGYAPTFLYANTKDQSFHCVVGSDHEASYTDYEPTPVEAYLESALKSTGLSRSMGARSLDCWWRI